MEPQATYERDHTHPGPWGEPDPEVPVCALCAGPGSGSVAELHLTHNVTVMLCAVHRSLGFLRQAAGLDFTEALRVLWAAAGCLTESRRRALRAHQRRVGSARPLKPPPGSYAWPHLRRLAEERFAAGEAPNRVLAICA